MGMPKKRSRILVVGGVRYRWRVSYDWYPWSKGYAAPARVVIESADRAGQRLVASFVGCRRDPTDSLREPFTPGFARRLVLAGLAKGWQPGRRGLPPVMLAHADVLAAATGAPTDSAAG